MYLSKLSDQEKGAFFRLACHLIAHDGVEPQEHALLSGAVGEMQLRGAVAPANVDIRTECQLFKSVESRKIAAVELMMLALADRRFQRGEQRLINRILGDFGFTPNELDGLLKWADRWFEVYNAADEFVGARVKGSGRL
jgi:hypothetical protein